MAKKPTVISNEEAATVEDFIRGRTATNEGARLTKKAKKFFETSDKKRWESAQHVITQIPSTRNGLDQEALRKAHPKIYEKFYGALPCITYEVTKK